MVLHTTLRLACPPQPRRPGPAAARAAPVMTLSRAIGLVGRLRRQTRSRRLLLELSRLDDRLLRDIGLTRDALLWEAEKPFAGER